jgi:hypothetical protein
MRGLKSTIALLVVLVGLGAYIYFVTWKLPAEGSSTTKTEKVFDGLTTDKIDEIRVQSESGEVTSVKKGTNGWQIAMPLVARASDTEVGGITTALQNIEVTKVIEDNPTDLKQYGLDPPRMVLVFKSPDAKSSGKLTVGEKTATGGGLYAKRNDENRVFLIPAYQESSLNKSTFDLRDKAIVSLQHDKVDGVEVLMGDKVIQFAKSGSDWKLVKPLAAKADFPTVESLISRVETAQMKSIVTEQPTPADLKKYGLDKPDVTVNVSMGGKRTTLMVGGKAADGNYARDPTNPAVVTVEGTLVGDLKKEANDYRPKSVFEFRSYNATHVEITSAGQTLVVERVKAATPDSADKWRRVSPNPGDADKDKVESLLTGLADISITSFTDSTAKTGLDAPVLTVDAKFEDGKKEEKVVFGKSGSDVYVSRPNDPGAGKIDSDRYDEAVKKFNELLK